jgi:hypothetical protein
VLAPDGGTRYVALGMRTQASTVLEAVRTEDGATGGYTDLRGSWGVPVLAGQEGEGVSADGRTLVLGDTTARAPRTSSSFVVLDTRTFAARRTIELKGDFAFDALSPHARRLYLIQHVPGNDLSRYVVRGYDLRSGRLLPGRIADRTQRSWVMAGYPVNRATSRDGRWVYTLYASSGNGYPFVHALDTVRGVAHCVGVPWSGSGSAPWNMRLTLGDGGHSLAVHWLSGRPYVAIDTVSWRVTHVHHVFPWLWPGAATGAVGLAAAALLLVRRRRRRALEEELAELLREQETPAGATAAAAPPRRGSRAGAGRAGRAPGA